ncbi:hypothetical protein HLB23_20760 [Nocardia uniformis]|uniref:Uncharacterized protein n=1 Tax=Nocardia uniformis TaxID=53432 RepID=A0A849C777_9NOCA|nr:hypothetical protein [Nocardia uniformis]NNH72260.1 hypothetical protein [Nocardia uniformis]
MIEVGELLEKIVGEIEAVDGLRAAAPFGLDSVTWLPRGGKSYAVDIGKEVIEIRVVASRLPLRPLLQRLTAAVSPLLAGTEWAGARVRVVVAELDAAAFGDTTVT